MREETGGMTKKKYLNRLYGICQSQATPVGTVYMLPVVFIFPSNSH